METAITFAINNFNVKQYGIEYIQTLTNIQFYNLYKWFSKFEEEIEYIQHAFNYKTKLTQCTQKYDHQIKHPLHTHAT